MVSWAFELSNAQIAADPLDVDLRAGRGRR